MDTKIRIFLIDDHGVLRAGLKMLFDAEKDMLVVGEASSAGLGKEQIAALKPDVVILDISMPEGSGLEALEEIRQCSPDSRFLILTMHNDEGYLRRAMANGASGYVLTQAADDSLLAAIRVVSQGGMYLHPAHLITLFDGKIEKPAAQTKEENEYNRLSPREKEILLYIAMGYTNRQAAEKMFLSEKSIETYKARLMAKLGLHSRVELVRFALRLGLIKS